MPLTVRELVQIPHLTLRVLAGASGLHRSITWSHTTDLPEPWRWISPGELMMTNGMSFPSAEDEQVALLEQLDAVGAGALAIGEKMYCPPLTEGFCAAADALALPVLWIRYPMPFDAISRTIAEATQPEKAQRLTRTARIYDAIGHSLGHEVDRSRLREPLSSVLECEVAVCSTLTGESYFPEDPSPEEEKVEAIRSGRGLLTSGNRVVPLSDGRALHIVPVPSREDAVLAVTSTPGHLPDTLLLQHAATVAALELSLVHLELSNTRRAGAELADAVLTGTSRAPSAALALNELGLDPARAVTVAAHCEDPERLRELHIGLWRRRIPHATTVHAGLTAVLLRDRREDRECVVDVLGEDGRLGVSTRVGTVPRYAESWQQATWALGMARRSGTAIVEYGAISPTVGPTDRDDARALVEHHLGPLLEYDGQHDGILLPTLEAFLGNRRSWQRTAEVLQIHRQTVRYRIERVQELIGVDLAESADLAQIWLALQARRALEGMP